MFHVNRLSLLVSVLSEIAPTFATHLSSANLLFGQLNFFIWLIGLSAEQGSRIRLECMQLLQEITRELD